MKNLTISKVATLAASLRRSKNYSATDAFKRAWLLVKTYPDASVVVFTTVSGKRCARLVYPWTRFNEVKGTGRPLKEGQKVYTDINKLHTVGKENAAVATISVYSHKVEKWIKRA